MNERFLDPGHGFLVRNAAPQEQPSAFWAQQLQGLCEVAADATLEGEGGSLRARVLGAYLISHARGPGLRLIRSLSAIAQGGFDGFALRLTVAGRLHGRAGDRHVACAPGDLLLLDLLEPFDLMQAADGETTEDVTLWLPRARALQALVDERGVFGLHLGAASPAGATLGAALRALDADDARAPARELEALADGLLAMLAKLAAAQPARNPAGAASASFVTIRRYIDRHLQAPTLGVDSLAKTFGISRATLYRLFEPVGGVALYIRQARLRLAHREIAEGGADARRIGVIAYQLGFKNVSAFSRAFRESFGESPSGARRRGDEARSPADLIANGGGYGAFAACLNALSSAAGASK